MCPGPGTIKHVQIITPPLCWQMLWGVCAAMLCLFSPKAMQCITVQHLHSVQSTFVVCSDADSKLYKPKTVIFRVKRLCSGKKAKPVQSCSNCTSMSAFNMSNEAWGAWDAAPVFFCIALHCIALSDVRVSLLGCRLLRWLWHACEQTPECSTPTNSQIFYFIEVLPLTVDHLINCIW